MMLNVTDIPGIDQFVGKNNGICGINLLCFDAHYKTVIIKF